MIVIAITVIQFITNRLMYAITKHTLHSIHSPTQILETTPPHL